MLKGTNTDNDCEGDNFNEMESTADTWKRAQSNVRLISILTKDFRKIRIAKRKQFLESDIHHEDLEFSCDEDEENSNLGDLGDSEDDDGEGSEDSDDEDRQDKKKNSISGPLGLLHLMIKKTTTIEVLPAKQTKTRKGS